MQITRQGFQRHDQLLIVPLEPLRTMNLVICINQISSRKQHSEEGCRPDRSDAIDVLELRNGVFQNSYATSNQTLHYDNQCLPGSSTCRTANYGIVS